MVEITVVKFGQRKKKMAHRTVIKIYYIGLLRCNKLRNTRNYTIKYKFYYDSPKVVHNNKRLHLLSKFRAVIFRVCHFYKTKKKKTISIKG